jgi:putative transposase
MNSESPDRSRPARGVIIQREQPTLIFLTVCTRHRNRWLASDKVHRDLVTVWQSTPEWAVGTYVVMPDHLHLLTWPRSLDLDFDRWVTLWKSRFSLLHGDHQHRWQAGSFHHRIRSFESAEEKRTYLLMNPVRAGLVSDADGWPYQGELSRSEDWW